MVFNPNGESIVCCKRCQLEAPFKCWQARLDDAPPFAMDTAPTDGTPILVFGEVDGGEYTAAAGWVIAFWMRGEEASDYFGEHGGWCLSHCGRHIASVENAQYWMPLPPNLDAQARLIEEARGTIERLCNAIESFHGIEMSGGDAASAHAHALAFLATLPAKGEPT